MSGGAATLVRAPAKISVRDVSKSFAVHGGTRVALDAVSFDVPANHIVGIVGSTGCGKTTLLNLIAGFDEPSSGRILVDGRVVTAAGPDRGFIFQHANVFPWLSVRDNVLFAARYGRGLDRNWKDARELEQKAEYYLRQVGLENAAKLFPYQISGGMKSRTAIARVLLANTSILLMDEPFAALDAQTRASMHRLLLQVFRGADERTVVLITHDVDEAILLSDTIYVMSGGPGRIVAKVDVPFERPREYAAVMRDPAFTNLKFTVLEQLQPFIEEAEHVELA
ncbi:MAG: ABC transporter ATP-binding protein [Candidatus Velthaea sp.]